MECKETLLMTVEGLEKELYIVLKEKERNERNLAASLFKKMTDEDDKDVRVAKPINVENINIVRFRRCSTAENNNQTLMTNFTQIVLHLDFQLLHFI
jgi:hypothetical protein